MPSRIPAPRARRTFSPISSVILLVWGCAPAAEQSRGNAVPIECALDGAASFSSDCLLETESGALIVRHPDGGFRRFTTDAAGRLRPLDGADVFALAEGSEGPTEIAVDGDRYRIPRDSGRPDLGRRDLEK